MIGEVAGSNFVAAALAKNYLGSYKHLDEKVDKLLIERDSFVVVAGCSILAEVQSNSLVDVYSQDKLVDN